MMDCKQALTEANGDADKAIEILRKRGADMAGKRAGRETGEGRIACAIDQGKRVGSILEFRCESAPVSNNPEFKALADAMAAAATAAAGEVTPESLMSLPAPNAAGRTCKDLLNDVVNKIRENMQVTRVAKLSGRLGSYVHFNGRIGVLLQVDGDGGNDELLADLCMHITAMKPFALSRADVPASVIEKEKEIGREQAKTAGKPENLWDKIATGKLNRWYSENVLLDQEFANVDKFKGTISALLAKNGNLKIVAYHRFEVGG
jgi:elongation factor Ts